MSLTVWLDLSVDELLPRGEPCAQVSGEGTARAGTAWRPAEQSGRAPCLPGGGAQSGRSCPAPLLSDG